MRASLVNSSPLKLNSLLYGRSGSGKSHLAATSPKPLILNISETATTYLTKFPDVPVVDIGDTVALDALITEPEYFIKEMLSGSKFDTDIETFVFDSATMLSRVAMGQPQVRDENRRVIRQGTGIMATDRTRDTGPSIEDYRELNWYMTGFFDNLRMLNDRYHTVVTAHAHVSDNERDARRTLKEKSKNPGEATGLPVLPGKLQWHADNMCDFFLYCESRREGRGLKFYAHTEERGLWHARTKLYGLIDMEIENPTFDKIYSVYVKSLTKEDK